MARGWKRAAELILNRGGIARLAARRSRPATAVLAYHNIVPAGEPLAGEASLHIDRDDFARQLDWLQEHATIVPLAGAFDRDRAPEAGATVAITFDDAYRGTMSAGLEELSRRDLPATVFVPTGLLGADGFWWDRLVPTSDDALHPEIRDHALWKLGGRGPEVLRWARQQGIPVGTVPDHARPVSESELRDLSERGRIALGAHSVSHANLAGLPTSEADRELRESREWIREALPTRFTDWVAYPYGLYGPEVEDAAGSIFTGALLISGGLASVRAAPPVRPHAIPRINVPRGLSVDGLALRLSGLLSTG